MTSEWRYIFPISVKNEGARESSSRVVLKIEQNMQIKHGYQAVVSDLDFSEMDMFCISNDWNKDNFIS